MSCGHSVVMPRKGKENKAPICHMKPMKYQMADDGCMQVEYYECSYCGHTKEISRNLAG